MKNWSATIASLIGCIVLCPLATRADIPEVQAKSAYDFCRSIGANSAIALRGETLDKTIECAKYVGIKWFRSGIEGSPSVKDLIELHKKTGARFSWSPGSGGSDLQKLLSTARELSAAGALLAFEGPNEPNNWGVTYNGKKGGGNESWLPVAELQRDLYAAVKADPILKTTPVWGISECGAETDNVGLQYLKIPQGADTVLPAGTAFSDYANVHNYIYHGNSPNVEDNKTWHSADPGPKCKVDGLFGEYGITWGKHYKGYTEQQLQTLPRVTTETGTTIDGKVTEDVHARNILTLYLDQFTRGWSYTGLYLLRDRVDEGGNQQFGLYKPDYTPRKAAVYLHNLTSILADKAPARKKVSAKIQIDNEPETMHHLLLQKSTGEVYLVLWNEQVHGSTRTTVHFRNKLTRAMIYDPTIGTEPIVVVENVNVLTVNLTDHPVIIQL